MFLHVACAGKIFDGLLQQGQLIHHAGGNVDEEDGEGASRVHALIFNQAYGVAVLLDVEGFLGEIERVALGITAVHVQFHAGQAADVAVGNEELGYARGILGQDGLH